MPILFWRIILELSIESITKYIAGPLCIYWLVLQKFNDNGCRENGSIFLSLDIVFIGRLVWCKVLLWEVFFEILNWWLWILFLHSVKISLLIFRLFECWKLIDVFTLEPNNSNCLFWFEILFTLNFSNVYETCLLNLILKKYKSKNYL